VVGTTGRIEARKIGFGGEEIPFAYDDAGRRVEDNRFVYQWDWRGQLATVVVKESWPSVDPDSSEPITPTVNGYEVASHKLVLTYDAVGRLFERLHLGALPDGAEDDDANRPFIERRRSLPHPIQT
jgi:hypothetical protein